MFAAFVWHEGIVHDTMAVASYLKFHPGLSKQGQNSEEPQQSKETKARQRHSVEVGFGFLLTSQIVFARFK